MRAHVVDLIVGDLSVVILGDGGERCLLGPVGRGGAAEQRRVQAHAEDGPAVELSLQPTEAALGAAPTMPHRGMPINVVSGNPDNEAVATSTTLASDVGNSGTWTFLAPQSGQASLCCR